MIPDDLREKLRSFRSKYIDKPINRIEIRYTVCLLGERQLIFLSESDIPIEFATMDEAIAAIETYCENEAESRATFVVLPTINYTWRSNQK
jgi:hypothetical protein